MPKPLLVLPFLLFLLGGSILLLTWGYQTAQARSIPWDCADWQAFAHADRTTAILESLAENRGKTLYCGIDQSDTFAKAETWQAGKDRNERDDTVYFGERGQFRGFIAAQEGWLTEGESGITGQSIATIFEFPREERRRVWRTKRLTLPPHEDRLVITNKGPSSGAVTSDATAKQLARTRFTNGFLSAQAVPTPWLTLSEPVARAACKARGYQLVGVTPSPDESNGWDYGPDLDSGNNYWEYEARKTNTYTAFCKKRVRRTRD